MATQLKKTVKPSGGDYTSLEACVNDNEQDLVTADKYFDVEISGEWESADTTGVTIHNYTTDATRYINIYTTGDARHSGVFSTSKYRIYDNFYARAVVIASNYVTLDGIQVHKNLTGYTAIDVSGASYCIIKNNICFQAASGGEGITSTQNANPNYIYNNIIYNFGTGIGTFFLATDVCHVYNNTVYGCSTAGIKTYSTSIYKNNISYNNFADYTYSGGLGTHSNNLSKDTTSPDDDYDSATLTFTNTTAGSEDFRLVSTDTDAINAGADMSALFDTDIIGTSRPQGASWDIGAFEYISAVSTIKRRLLMGCGV